MTNENGHNWDGLLDAALFAFRTSVNASIKQFSFQVMLVRSVSVCESQSESSHTELVCMLQQSTLRSKCCLCVQPVCVSLSQNLCRRVS